MTNYSLDILSDDNVLQNFRKQAHTQATNFCIDKILPRYEEVYTQLINT